jgi:flagellar basal-body rod protein FlgB
MQLFDTTQLALERAITGASRRHAAIASNIANANTPGYQPVDVDFHSALRGALGEETAAAARAGLEGVTFTAERDATAVMRADGSGFDVEAQTAKLAENGLEYEALVAVTKNRVEMLRSAMGIR